MGLERVLQPEHLTNIQSYAIIPPPKEYIMQSQKLKNRISELKAGFLKRMEEFGVNRSAWLFFDFVCNGDSHSRDRLISDFQSFQKRKRPKKSVSKWMFAIRWYAERSMTNEN